MRRGKLRSTLWIWVMTLSILGSRSAVRVSAAETRPAVSCEKADFVLPSAGAHRLLALTEDTSSPDRTDGTGSPADRSDAASETPEGGPDKSAGGTDGEAGTDLTDPGEAGMEERDGSGTASDKESAGADDAMRLTPPLTFSLEQCLEFVEDDELCEVTPKSIRLRKKILNNDLRAKTVAKAKKDV